jgi:hypothetical protein
MDAPDLPVQKGPWMVQVGQGAKEMWSPLSFWLSSNWEPLLALVFGPNPEHQSSSGTWVLPTSFAQNGSLQFCRLVCAAKQPKTTHAHANMASRLAQSKLDLIEGMLQSNTLKDK